MSSEARAASNDLKEITISLTSDRQILEGWSGLQIVRAFDTAADSFAFSFPWEATAENRRRFVAFRTTACEVRYGNDLVISGIVEKYSAQYSASTRSLTIEGRSRSGVLVDLSAPPGMYSGKFSDLAREVCPQGVTVRTVPAVFPAGGEVLLLDVDAGQTAFQALTRLASGQGLWALPQPDGSLLFRKFRAGAPVADLEEGQSPLTEIDSIYDLTQRFYRYRGVSAYDGSLTLAEVLDTGVDPVLRDGRIFQPPVENDPQETVNQARSRGIIDAWQCNVTVTGWTINGKLWSPGMAVTLVAPSAMLYNKVPLIVSRAVLQYDETGGAQTQLRLTLAGAYNNEVSAPYPWSLT